MEKMRQDKRALDYAYFYSIQVKNEGPKKIRSLAWDYIFNDPGSKQELERHSFRTFVAVGINQTKWMKVGPWMGPPQMVSVEGLQKDKRSPFDERIEIKCVLYADGTGWHSSDKEQSVCDELVKFTLNPPRRRR